ncbi:unnamed protein product [Pleuronectes platessa]|uniref:Uncharacterized protein n=1 Tax=Pleuronectes platessa TaxID=8262 RepID=A0A9N7Y8A8_PLEPL|nr:unnamed protein product [Pleuronectes platessa]
MINILSHQPFPASYHGKSLPAPPLHAILAQLYLLPSIPPSFFPSILFSGISAPHASPYPLSHLSTGVVFTSMNRPVLIAVPHVPSMQAATLSRLPRGRRVPKMETEREERSSIYIMKVESGSSGRCIQTTRHLFDSITSNIIVPDG